MLVPRWTKSNFDLRKRPHLGKLPICENELIKRRSRGEKHIIINNHHNKN